MALRCYVDYAGRELMDKGIIIVRLADLALDAASFGMVDYGPQRFEFLEAIGALVGPVSVRRRAEVADKPASLFENLTVKGSRLTTRTPPGGGGMGCFLVPARHFRTKKHFSVGRVISRQIES